MQSEELRWVNHRDTEAQKRGMFNRGIRRIRGILSLTEGNEAKGYREKGLTTDFTDSTDEHG